MFLEARMSEKPNERPDYRDPMTRIEVKLIKIGVEVGHIKGKVSKIDARLEGNGELGLVLQVDRHHQWIKSVRKWIAILSAAIVGLIVAIARDVWGSG